MSSKKKSRSRPSINHQNRRNTSTSPLIDKASSLDSEVDSNWGLSVSVQKQLWTDIERQGGFSNLNLASLCDNKEDVYGRPGSSLRRKVQNKVDRWKTKKAAEFENIKRNLGFTQDNSFVLSNDDNNNDAKQRTNKTQQQSSTTREKSQQPVATKKGGDCKSFFSSFTRYSKKSSSEKKELTMDDLVIDRKFCNFLNVHLLHSLTS